MQVIARVIRREGDIIHLRFSRPDEGCSRCGVCGNFNLFPLNNNITLTLNDSKSEYNVGDILILYAKDYYYYLALFMAFILPIFIMVISAYLGLLIFNNDGLSGLFSIIGLILYAMIILRSANRYFSNIFSIKARIATGDDNTCKA